MSNLQVAIYARVSSEQQVEDATIESQLSALRERIDQDGMSLTGELTFIDDGYSGDTLIRPAMERLRDMVAMQAVDRLYVLCPDRLARRYAYQVLLFDEFLREGVEVVFLNKQLGQSPEDNLLLQVQGMMAEYERAKILERSRRGKRYGAKRGKVSVLSGAPYGYRYVTRREGSGEARYEVIPDEARVVRQVFQWIGGERLSIGEVCRRLNRAGEHTRTGRTVWDRATVWGILRNPAYKGAAAFGKTEAVPMKPKLRIQRGDPPQPHRAVCTVPVSQEKWISVPVPALVSEDLFDSVQLQLEENRRHARQSKRGARYLLQGLLVCARCQYAFYGKPISPSSAKGRQRSYAYYRCIGTDAYRFGGERVCDNHQVRTDTIDSFVWHEVHDLLMEPKRVEEEFRRRLRSPDKGKEDMAEAQIQLGKLRSATGRLIDSYTEGLITKEEFEPRIARLRERMSATEKKLQELRDTLSQESELRLLITCLEDFAAKVQDGLDDADWLTKRELIRSLVKRVEIGKEEVNVIFRITPGPFDFGPGRGRLQHCWRGERSSLRSPFRSGCCDASDHKPCLKIAADELEYSLVPYLSGHPRHENVMVYAVERRLALMPPSITETRRYILKSR